MSTPKHSKLYNYRAGTTPASPSLDWGSQTLPEEFASPHSSLGDGGGSPVELNDSNRSSASLTPNLMDGTRLEANSKRGRPRSEALTTLMIEGSTSPSAIKCKYCHRVFPRDKSLQAHLRTHTGEFRKQVGP